jgi:hypothetical protein
MTRIRVSPIPTEHALAIWNGGTDAHDMAPERHVSDGSGVPCRHCLRQVAGGEPYLILAYRPFPKDQPYAEVGPIFLHAEPCDAYRDHNEIPATYLGGEPRIVRGYSRDDRIRYDTGKVVEPERIADYARALLDDPETAYVQVRSSTNNCYAFRIDRSD